MTLISIFKKIVPILATATAVAVVPPSPNWETPLECLEKKDYKGAAQTFVAGMTGIELGEFANFDLMATLNPVDLKRAPYTKVALWSSITMELIGKVGAFVRNIISEID